MEYFSLKTFFSESPVARLFRRDNPAMILSFLHETFVATPRMSIPEAQLIALLAHHIAGLEESGEGPFGEPTKMVEDWCSQGFGILVKYPDKEGEVVCEMTADAHKVVSWIQNLTTTEFVAAESKIKSLWRDIQTMVERATSNPADRLDQLQRQVDTLLAEMDEIHRTGKMDVMTPIQVNGDFVRLTSLVREIPGDFRTVEEKLQRVAQAITTRMVEEDANRGEIVRLTLDADEELRKSEQGQSFEGFWQFLMAPGQRDVFESMVDLLYRIDGLSDLNRANPALRSVFRALLREGEKVIRSQQRISGQLRRAMDVSVRANRRAVIEAIREIKRQAMARRGDFAGCRQFISIDDEPEMTSLMTRPLYEPTVAEDLTVTLKEAEQGTNHALLAEFSRMQPIHFERLKANLRALLRSREIITLADIIEAYPPSCGLIEVIAYISIAAESPRNVVDPTRSEDLALPWLPANVRLRVPQVIIQTVP